MFQAITKLINDAGLKGVDIGIRIVGKNTISVLVSFQHGAEFNLTLLDKNDDANVTANADKIVALRAAMNTPLVVMGSPDEVMGKLQVALESLREGVVAAATTYTALDITALLTKAATQAKSAKQSTKGKEASTQKGSAVKQPDNEPEMEPSDEDGDENQAGEQLNPNPTRAVSDSPKACSFDSFDSL